MKKRELLAPAGSYAVCEAVLAAGADAVYLGGDRFSARAYAPNFSEKDILRALDLAHLFDRKIYLAVNILLKNREVDRELYSYLKPYYEHGLDAIIVQDYGVFQFVRRNFPDLPVHVSTQMAVAGTCGAALLKEQGAKRIIPARELSLAEIRTLYDRTQMEIECFVHGALCYCYSGQCLMSSVIGGRSGNRGRCAQPCRLPYNVQDKEGHLLGEEADYPLSLKDLCAIDLLPQLCAAGVCAFKIEGRMKSLAYAAGVTGIYREYLDRYEQDPAHYAVRESDRMRLLALGNRNGFTTGYYTMHGGAAMQSGRVSAHVSSGAEEVYEPQPLPKQPIMGAVVLHPGEPALLSVQDEAGHAVTVTGETAQDAVSRPLSEADIRFRITRTGETPFAFSHLTVDRADCFVPLGKLNTLRRDALNALTESILRERRREAPALSDEADAAEEETENPILDVVACTKEQLHAALASPFVACISLDLDTSAEFFSEDGCFLNAAYFEETEKARAAIQAAGKQTGFCFPYVFREKTFEQFDTEEWRQALRRYDVLWVRSFDSLGFCLSKLQIDPAQIRLDGCLYVFSAQAWQAFSRLGVGGYTASAELNAGELSHMPNAQAEFSVYGTMPLMISAQCLMQNIGPCRKTGRETPEIYLSDRLSRNFPVKQNCRDCYQVIYNNRPLYLLHRAEEIGRLGFGRYRISFVREEGAEAARILEAYRRAFVEGESVAAPADPERFTNGHFHRGVE